MTCAVCGNGDVQRLLGIPRVPVFCNQVCQTKPDAERVATASIALTACSACGHVYNGDFREELVQYSPEYENSLHFSARFESFADELVERIDSRVGLAGKTIVEVGCGRGDFLKKLCSKERTRGFGFDKSYPGVERDESRKDNVLIRAEHYTDAYGELKPGLLCCRHVVEHIQAPVDFLRSLRRTAMGGDAAVSTVVYFEVPNALYTLRDGGIWDILYEHCGYFTPASMAKAFELAGYGVDSIEETFGGQFLSLFGSAKGKSADDLEVGHEDYQPLFEAFSAAYDAQLERARQFLAKERAAGRKVVVWGAGTKGTMYLNTIADPKQGFIEYIVDVNPRKWQKFVPGSGQQIVAPEALDTYRPDTVIVMNPAYAEEIRRTLASRRLEPTLHLA